MFCMKCGNQFPDGSAACPNCGAPAAGVPEQPVAVQPAAPVEGQPVAPVAGQPVPQQPYAQPFVPAKTSSFKYDIGGFFNQFFKSPVEACTLRDKPEHFLLGLTFPVAFLLINLIFDLAFKKDAAIIMSLTSFWTSVGFLPILVGIKTGRAFANFFVRLIAFGALFGYITAMYKVFKVKKTDFLSTISWTGLAFLPYAALNTIGWICTKIVCEVDSDYLVNFSDALCMAGMAFFFIVLYDYFFTNREANGSKKTAIFFAVSSVLVFQIAQVLFGFFFQKLFF